MVDAVEPYCEDEWISSRKFQSIQQFEPLIHGLYTKSNIFWMNVLVKYRNSIFVPGLDSKDLIGGALPNPIKSPTHIRCDAATEQVGQLACGNHLEEETFDKPKPTVRLRVMKPVARCNVPMVNPYTCDTDFDPMSILGPYRSGRTLMANKHTYWYEFYKKQKTSTFWSVNLGIFAHGPNPCFNVGDKFIAHSEKMV